MGRVVWDEGRVKAWRERLRGWEEMKRRRVKRAADAEAEYIRSKDCEFCTEAGEI